ncbi:iron complex outermembrane receptor protein [Flavobacterium endophyticum]|uniref:Iron complex outermembrane receptor protein n=1 Tax=Flavobacterium endophyticum TaxID=1540163 RepID=A0A495LXI1_9FLAO|nr:TonB-dependent receptor [Flavobacterium endophyticum]RKS18446.1 iron complex outermembrane receptor protein [Flavobacterium endophyticum]
MTFKKLYLFLLFSICQSALAQHDSIHHLEVVEISDLQLKNYSDSQSVLKLSDSIINKNQASLTSLLNYNTVIYFKENGLGMVSSPSFRGTTAQQTAVIWNGININSQLNGQTDFNTITTRDFNSISVRAGGGSSIYGSSAIGGSIHLNNTVKFEDHFSNSLRLNYGSFNTFGGNYKLDASDGKFSAQVSISRNSSDNDYDYVDSDDKNLNGQYYNTSMNAAIGYKINDNNFLKLYSYVFDGERHFSLIFPSEIKTKYQDLNTRNLLEWDSFFGRFVSKVKVGALSEKYKYFDNIDSESYTFGEVKTYIGKYDLAFQATDAIQLNAILDYTQNKGKGSDIKNEQRNIGSASLLLKHNLTKKLLYEASVRKEFTNNYKSPLLFSLGMSWKAADFYTLKLNGSKNFRVPTFNDLYWQPGGNENLKPESSYQAELGNEFRFNTFKITLTGYYIDIKDMLRWIPNGSNWSPQNTNKVRTYGGEAIVSWSKNFGNHHVMLNGTYGYTVSEDMEKKKQLIYVPYHKATSSLSYSWKKLSADYQLLYNGEVFTRSDNNSRYNIDAYLVSNASLHYDFGKKNSCILGFQVLNLLDEKYASVESRYLPGRNFNMYLTLNF